jgi:hypothetical protein
MIILIKKLFLISIFLNLYFSGVAQNISNNVTLIDTNEKYIINMLNIDGNYFTPIGWSENGYFAYGCQFRYYRGGYSIFQVTITNIITDRNIGEIRGTMTNFSTFKEFWDYNKQEITQLLESHSIVSFPNIQFESINNLKSLYGMEIDIKKGLYEDAMGFIEIRNNIIIRDINGKQKMIAQLGSKYHREDVLFYIKNPFEDRIVFYIESVQVDGAPSAGHKSYDFIGCHLTIGFE